MLERSCGRSRAGWQCAFCDQFGARPPSPAAAPLGSLERPLFVCRQGPPPSIECPLCVDGVECLFDRTRLCPVPGCGLSHRPPSSASRDTAKWRSCQDDPESSRESWCHGLFDLDHWDAPLKETHRPSHLDSFVPDARADGSRARESGSLRGPEALASNASTPWGGTGSHAALGSARQAFLDQISARQSV
jgi:hypothetical protein